MHMKKMKKLKTNKFLKNLFLIFFIISIIGCKKTPEKFTQERFLFGTYIQMIIYSDNKEKANSIMEKAFNEIARIDNKYNSKNKNSLIYKLNNSEIEKIELDEEGKYIFNEIQKMYEVTDGIYDITIEPLLKLWGFGEEARKSVPSQKEIEEVKKNIDFSKVKIKDGILTKEKNIKIDTGSFLKGYALDRAKEILRENGIRNGFISSISSIATINGKMDGSSWKIGLQNPKNQNERLGVLEIKDKSIGVSGDYQTYVEISGEKYHHIMNKNTGYPINDKRMVVVICSSAFLADIYSTSFFGMTEEKIKNFSNENNVEFLIVKTDNSITKSKNFKI